MAEPRTVPKMSLARIFPQGFNEFWQRLEFKKDLELIIYSYLPATDDREEIKKTLASGGYGWGAYAIVKHFSIDTNTEFLNLMRMILLLNLSQIVF